MNMPAETRYCPAGVYEMVEEAGKPVYQIMQQTVCIVKAVILKTCKILCGFALKRAVALTMGQCDDEA